MHLAPRAVFFIGYRAAGKSTVARRLAAALGLPWVDTDRLVEAELGSSIAECFLERGEPYFRERERAALGSLAERLRRGERAVVATGGGIILDDANVQEMRALGPVLWLQTSPARIRERLRLDPETGASRPALTGGSALDEVEAVLRVREPLYRRASDASFATDEAAPAATVEAVLQWLKAQGHLVGGCSK